jgi:hypothetical protein
MIFYIIIGHRSNKIPEAGHILFLRILYPIHIQAQKKDIISYPYPGPKKGYGYISSKYPAPKKDRKYPFWRYLDIG